MSKNIYFNELTKKWTDKPLRVKTEDEFIKDLGEEWRSKVYCGWSSQMNVYFGEELDIYDYKLDINGALYKEIDNESIKCRFFDYRGWTFSYQMLVNNKIDLFKCFYLQKKLNSYE